MATDKIYDAHFHLLFKHFLTGRKDVEKPVKVTGVAQLLDELFGGLFDSQSSPAQLANSNLFVGVTSLLAIEHAFANRILTVWNVDLSGILPLDKDLIQETRTGRRTYYDEFKRQLELYTSSEKVLAGEPFKIQYLRRNDEQWKNQTNVQIETILSAGDRRYLAFAIEGGHNLSNVPIHNRNLPSTNPELQLKEIQDRKDIDIMSMNLCHLSHIPEQPLGGFAQGLNRTAQIAFKSDDFLPKSGLGLTEKGKKVIRQALTHESKPVLIDVKHMSVYTRFHYYRYREQLIQEDPVVERLPIISSHTGFTFINMPDYVKEKKFNSNIFSDQGELICEVSPENRFIGKTNDRRNVNLYCNPWSIGLFDDEIVEIMESKGLIGVSMDQRVLGAVKMRDGQRRGKYYEKEFVSSQEWQKLFRDGQFPTGAEGLFERILRAPTRAERHIMLFCTHLVHAASLGYASLPWLEDTSPWDHLCIGSDYDGLINPLNGFNAITDMKKFQGQLLQYLPVADKFLDSGSDKALRYKDDGSVDKAFLEKVIDGVLFNNGVRFTASFLRNWY